ncbi:winged helix-turn-helix domain-containing protein [Blastococcus sp. SYSU DS0753]
MNGTTFRVLGPVEAWHDGRLLPCRRARHRAVLAAVLVDAGDVVPFDVLVDRVWSGRQPAAAATTLQAVISRLRRELEPDAAPGGWTLLVTREPGYRLAVDPEQVDAVRFVRLLRTARALSGQDVQAARSALAEGLDLWRGPAYATSQPRSRWRSARAWPSCGSTRGNWPPSSTSGWAGTSRSTTSSGSSSVPSRSGRACAPA